ncbi:Uncharacterised protein [Mobiluncus mulieris]|nr:Uncharacterised protein [Mobiluncus mulieris]
MPLFLPLICRPVAAEVAAWPLSFNDSSKALAQVAVLSSRVTVLSSRVTVSAFMVTVTWAVLLSPSFTLTVYTSPAVKDAPAFLVMVRVLLLDTVAVRSVETTFFSSRSQCGSTQAQRIYR